MGACASRVQEWREEAEEEVRPHKRPKEQQQQREQTAWQLPAPVPLPAAAPPPAAAAEPDGSSHWTLRESEQEAGMAHLVRHPRLHTFTEQGGQFGLGGAYVPVKLLGRGGTGQTWLCREAASDRLFAVKLQQRPIPRGTVRLTYNEITIQASTCVSSVHHSHIHEVVLTPSHLALVLQNEAGGSAAEFVAQQIPRVSRLDLVVSEDYARFMFRQLVEGLQHLHANHVAHRDVKLDNTLLDGEGVPTVKLCDYQFAKYWGRPRLTRMQTHLGTAVYMAPELLENRQSQQSYDPVEVDVWAAGIWLVALLCGAFPFDNRPGADDAVAEMQILHQERSAAWADSRFVRPYVGQLSAECVDLLNHVLTVDPDIRYTLQDVAAHPWLAAPLPPQLEAAWQRTRRAQLALERRLAGLTPDHDAVHQRNSRVFDLVREAAAPLDQWQHSHQRLVQACAASPRLTDCASIPGAVRIDMRPEAVAKRLGEKALSLLDAPPPPLPPGEAAPPATPQRFSIPLQTIDSNTSLASLAGSGGGEASLAPLVPSLGPSPLGSAAALHSRRSEASLASSTGTAEHASADAVPTPFAAQQRVPLAL